VARYFNKAETDWIQLIDNTGLPQETQKMCVGYIWKANSVPSGYPDRHTPIYRGDAGCAVENYIIMHEGRGITFIWTEGSGQYKAPLWAFTNDTNEHDILISIDWVSKAYRCWVDGAELSFHAETSPGAGTPDTVGTDKNQIGKIPISSDRADGVLSELMIWQGCVMTQADANMWHKRFVRNVKPEFCTRYWPLIDGLEDRVGGFTGTNQGTVKVPHPLVRYPQKAWV
jgi:hypothetical protein